MQGFSFAYEKEELLGFHNFQAIHGACLDAFAAHDALGRGLAFNHDHQVQGAGLHAVAALDAQLLIRHPDALGVLGDGFVGAGLGALAALNAGGGNGLTLLFHNLDARLEFVDLFVESHGAFHYAADAAHAFIFFDATQTLHFSSSLLKRAAYFGVQ